MVKIICVIIGVTFLAGCSQSLVYSPAVNIPNKPLREDEVDLQGGVEMLPEARAENIGGNMTTFGLSGQVGYGFTDNFNMTVRGWADIEEREDYSRSGFALNAQFVKQLNLTSSLIIVPRAGIAMYGDAVDGHGFGLSVFYHKELSEKLGFYGGAGGIWGFHQLMEKDRNEKGVVRAQMGFGVISNIGISWQFFDNFRLNCEINPLYQINSFDQNEQFIVAPQIGVGYIFRSER